LNEIGNKSNGNKFDDTNGNDILHEHTTAKIAGKKQNGKKLKNNTWENTSMAIHSFKLFFYELPQKSLLFFRNWFRI
jgi:hypothetical protein